MKKFTVKELSIAAIQLASMLGLVPLVKDEQKCLSRISATVQKLLVQALQDEGASETLRSAAILLADGVANLYSGTTGPIPLLIPAQASAFRLKLTYAQREKFWQELSGSMLALVEVSDLSAAEKLARRAAMPPEARIKHQQDLAMVTRMATSIAMNSTWEIALAFLAATDAVWVSHNQEALEAALFSHFSSGQGRAQVDDKVAILWPKSGTSSWSLLDVVQVTVSLDRSRLQGNPVVQKMIRHPAAHLPVKTTLGTVFEKLAASVEPGMDPTEVAKNLLKDVESAARRRIRELDAAKKERSKQATAAAEARLLEQLKGLPDNLRDALKKNPDLLKQI